MQFTATYDLPVQVVKVFRRHWNILKNQFGKFGSDWP